MMKNITLYCALALLAAVSGDGRVRQRLTSAAGDVQDPAWGPMPTN